MSNHAYEQHSNIHTILCCSLPWHDKSLESDAYPRPLIHLRHAMARVVAKPDENTTAHVIGLCDLSCQQKSRQMPMCPKCHTDDKRYFQIKPGGVANSARNCAEHAPCTNLCGLRASDVKAKGKALSEVAKNLEKAKADANRHFHTDIFVRFLLCGMHCMSHSTQ